MELRVLGPIELWVDGREVTPTSPNQRRVLAVLAAHPDDQVRIDTLIEALWGDDPPPSAERTLRSYVSRLRSATGPSIVASAGGFTLRTTALAVDAADVESEVSAARLQDPAEAARTLDAALRRWRGDAFGALAELDAVAAAARALEQRRLGARHDLAEAQRRSGDLGAAVASAEALLAESPLGEGAWETLIRGLTGAVEDLVGEQLGAERRVEFVGGGHVAS